MDSGRVALLPAAGAPQHDETSGQQCADQVEMELTNALTDTGDKRLSSSLHCVLRLPMTDENKSLKMFLMCQF